MGVDVDLSWQPSLLDLPAPRPGAGPDGDGPGFDGPGFDGLCRHELAHGAWVDVVPGWLPGADALFDRLLLETPWRAHELRMYDAVVPEPRLTHRWVIGREDPPDDLRALAGVLGARYGVTFGQIGANLYRDGADSVAWHGDRVARELPSAVVALVALGASRPLRLRPTGGGESGAAGSALDRRTSLSLPLASGDLLVMGGSCQRTWQHSVPKVAGPCGPRISVQFRHAYPDGDGPRRRAVRTGR